MGRVTRIVLICAVVWLVLWVLASLAVPKIFGAVLPRLSANFHGAGVTLQQLDFDDVNVSPSLIRVKVSNLSALFDLEPQNKRHLKSKFVAAETEIYIKRPVRRRGGVELDNFEVLFDPSDRPEGFPFDGFSRGYMHIHDLPLTNPTRAVGEIIDGLEELFLQNELVGDFEFSGEVLIRVEERTMPALIYTERQGEHFRLRFSKPDIEKIAQAANVQLSDEQIEIVSVYPPRVPALIEITDQARDYSQAEFPKQSWLKDALRHVSWSYLLTREFGADFAKQVTDAHEQNPGNTENERLMDYNNNAVGRVLAQDGTLYEELPLHVLAHEDIVRDPDEVETRVRLLR